MNIGYHKKLVGVVNDDRYGRGVEHVGKRRKTIVELAQRAEDIRCLEEAKEDLDKLEQENEKNKEEAVEWGERANELEKSIDKILTARGIHKGAKAAAIARYKDADKVRLAVELNIVEEELAKTTEKQEGGGLEDVMKVLKGLFKTAKKNQDSDLSTVVKILSDSLELTRKGINRDTKSAMENVAATLSENFLDVVKPCAKEARISELEGYVSRYNLERQRFDIDIKAVKGERDTLQRQVNRLKSVRKEADGLLQQVGALQDTIKTLEGKLLDLTTANDDLGEDLRKQLKESQSQVAHLEEQAAGYENVCLELAAANRRIAELEQKRRPKTSTISSLSFEGVDHSSLAATFPRHRHLSRRDRPSTPSSRDYEAQSSSAGSIAMVDAADNNSSAGSKVTPDAQDDHGRLLDDSSMEIQGKEKVFKEYRSPQERARMQAFTFSRAALTKSRLPPWRVAVLKLRAPAAKPLNPNAAPWAPVPPAPYGFPPMMPPPWLPLLIGGWSRRGACRCSLRLQ
jgi:hypothetical protein